MMTNFTTQILLFEHDCYVKLPTSFNKKLLIILISFRESESRLRGVDVPGEVTVVNHERDEQRQFLNLRLGQTLPAGKQYELSLEFTGELNDQLQGFYRSSYIEDNQTR
jgi:hypothetical protein